MCVGGCLSAPMWPPVVSAVTFKHLVHDVHAWHATFKKHLR